MISSTIKLKTASYIGVFFKVCVLFYENRNTAERLVFLVPVLHDFYQPECTLKKVTTNFTIYDLVINPI